MIIGGKVRLREKKTADALNDYSWRADPELAELDAVPPLNITFAEYLQGYVFELEQPSTTRRAFAIETLDGKHIGNGVYYNIDETKGEAELGIIIGNRDYWNKNYGTSAVNTLVEHIFRKTNLKRIYLKTLESNLRAQACFLKCYFLPHGHSIRDGLQFMLMELYRTRWTANKHQTNGQAEYV